VTETIHVRFVRHEVAFRIIVMDGYAYRVDRWYGRLGLRIARLRRAVREAWLKSRGGVP
jgi:hypothetical protein